MKLLFPAFIVLALSGCASSTTVRAPSLPALPASIANPCPPLPLLTDNTIGGLVMADALAATEYARCKAKHAAAVAAYNKARKGGKK